MNTDIATFDAVCFARAYRAAALLTAADDARPLLNAVHAEIFDGIGARLVASDGFALVVCFAGAGPNEKEPDIDEAPDWTVSILDPDGVLGKVAQIAGKHAAGHLKAGIEPPELTLTVAPNPDAEHPSFDGLASRIVTVQYGRVIEGTGREYEAGPGNELPWRDLLAKSGRPKPTDQIVLSASRLGQICAAASIMGDSVRWELAGRNRILRFTVDPVYADEAPDDMKYRVRSRPGCYGALMPIRMYDGTGSEP